MHKNAPVFAALLSILTLAGSVMDIDLANAAPQSAQSARAAVTRSIVDAADAFLKSLRAEQRQAVQFGFVPQKTAAAARFARTGPRPQGPDGNGPDGDGEPARKPGGGPGMGPPGGFVGEKYGEAVWSNYPVSDVPRPGLQLGSLTAEQRAAAMHMLQVLLSPKGYQKVLDIMGSDQALSEMGQPFASGEDVYTIGLFGTPGTAAPWMIEFGGHHLGLNIVIAGDHGAMTPTLTGAQPSIYTRDGQTVRVLAGENDKAFALLGAIDDSQRGQAILNYSIGDLVLGPGHAGEIIVPEGLKVSAMNEHQKALLLDLISEWAGIVNEAYAAPRMEEIKAGLDETWFAWSGPTTHEPDRNGSAYYRIQGPKLLIEFSPQGVGGDPTMHVHTIYRDPTNDYGVRFTLP